MSKLQKGTCTLSHYIFLIDKVQRLKCEWVKLLQKEKEAPRFSCSHL
jgi:hypothetical protein